MLSLHVKFLCECCKLLATAPKKIEKTGKDIHLRGSGERPGSLLRRESKK
ncbi:hypothetical protein C5167_008637 [Papaver somniferum]|uniref:Uncharacterized protein n=1 Tax=Papaver somniferum TaxID=3469 RepID=A0A4Y7JZ20_PAPSO|nr:hypothetical protein C5167_008637 [Papaver somniferum]